MSASRAQPGWDERLDEGFPAAGVIVVKPGQVQVLYANVHARGGVFLGRVKELYFDDLTDNAAWVTVTRRRGIGEAFIPVADAELTPDGDVKVPFSKNLIEGAPRVEAVKGHLSQDAEVQLFRHYGMKYGGDRASDFGRSADDGEEHEVVLHEEQVVVTKRAAPVERIRLGVETVTEQQQVTKEVRRQQRDHGALVLLDLLIAERAREVAGVHGL